MKANPVEQSAQELPEERRLGGGVGREHVGTLACREHRRYTVGKTRVGHNHLEP